MEVTYQGSASFLIKSDTTVSINPPDTTPAGIKLFSARQKSQKQIVNGPGEYEISGVLVVTVETGSKDRYALVHGVDLGGLTVAHLGPHTNLPDARALDALGKVDVLILGVDDLISAREAVTLLAPKVVLPFGAHAAALCSELGIKDPKPENKFYWNGVAAVPKAVLLKAGKSRRRAA